MCNQYAQIAKHAKISNFKSYSANNRKGSAHECYKVIIDAKEKVFIMSNQRIKVHKVKCMCMKI